MTYEEAVTIYELAVKAGACTGNITKAKEYLDKRDIEGFERVCRGSYTWLRCKGIHYELTDGKSESWHNNGQLCTRENYLNGELHGLCEWWYHNGQLWTKKKYLNGKLHGLYERWYNNGKLCTRENYLNGELHGPCEVRDRNGQLERKWNYFNGELVE